jgi:hypothetical protein
MIGRATARAAEVVLWMGLIWVCLLVITGSDQRTQTLTAAVIWAAPQMAGMIVGPFGQAVSQWIDASRFVLANWVVLLFGVDLLALALVSSHRWAEGWKPEIRLGEWMELPRLGRRQPAPVSVSAVDEINRRFNAWGRVAAASALTGATSLWTWLAEVGIPRAGRGLRKTAHMAGIAGRRVATEPRRLREQVVDAQVLAKRAGATTVRAADRLKEAGIAPQIGWTGGRTPKPPEQLRRSEQNVRPKRNRPERLAS